MLLGSRSGILHIVRVAWNGGCDEERHDADGTMQARRPGRKAVCWTHPHCGLDGRRRSALAVGQP